LITAIFFFYALGSDPQQKSLKGLFRTLLYQILAKSPSLIRNLLPDHWTKALSQPKLISECEVHDDDVTQAFKCLAKQQADGFLSEYSFCFFIDGLDEYQTTTAVDRREMVRALTDLANSSSAYFKLCVSSRIENRYMDMFSENARLYLHELTNSDMEEYVQGNFECVGTLEERQQLASSITRKAKGIFLWVVLVVQSIRRLSDDGARFPRLMSEIESLPSEMNELFQRILDSLGTTDRRLTNHTVSLLHFLAEIPRVKEMHLWLTLGDFYFLEAYEADVRFAETAQFGGLASETVKESELRAKRRLRGVCRGLIEADKTNDLEFTHRSVSDFFQQEKVRMEMHDRSFNNLEALSQLKLAAIQHYWGDAGRQTGRKGRKSESVIQNRHSVLAACLVQLRRGQNLDVPPYGFLTRLDTVPLLSVGSTISRALASRKTAFHISIAQQNDKDPRPYRHYEICHTSRVRHIQLDPCPYTSDSGESGMEYFHNDSEVISREIEEDVDDIEEYSRAVVSPLLTELCSGRLEYPYWRTTHIDESPLESESLAMLAYFSIGAGIGRIFWIYESTTIGDDDVDHETALIMAGLDFLQHLFQRQIVSPNSTTHIAFGGEFGFIRIAAGNQPLSIWQHFLCWWAVVAAASGDFDLETDGSNDEDASDDDSFTEGDCSNEVRARNLADAILAIFIKNGADLRLALRFTDRREVDTGADDWWLRYSVEMVREGQVMELDVVMNLESRMELRIYPYGTPKRWFEKNLCGKNFGKAWPAILDSPLSVRDLIDRSQSPGKDSLLKVIDERLRVSEPGDMPMFGPSQGEVEDVQDRGQAASQQMNTLRI
jgi:hypothetical protein